MEIIDVIMSSCELLNLRAERDLLKTATTENESTILANEEIKSLFNLIKFSTQELCSHYVPMITTQSFSTEELKYHISGLTNFIRMQGVYKNDEPVNYKIINRYIVMEEDGDYVAKFFTYPEIESLFDEIDFLENFSPDVLVFGLCSYYSLSHGMFEEFEAMHDKYLEKAESLKTLKVFDLPKRRWE